MRYTIEESTNEMFVYSDSSEGLIVRGYNGVRDLDLACGMYRNGSAVEHQHSKLKTCGSDPSSYKFISQINLEIWCLYLSAHRSMLTLHSSKVIKQ